MGKQKLNPYITASFFYIIGNGIGQGVILLSSIIFTRIMTQNDYGMYSTYYSIVSILNTLIGANLFNGLNNAYIDFKNEIHEYRASNLVLSSLVAFIISIIVLTIFFLFHIKTNLFFVVMALIHAYAFFVINYFNYSINMENRYKIKTILLMLPNIFQVNFSIVFILTLSYNGVTSRIIGSVFGVALCAIVVYIKMLRNHKHFFNMSYWKYGLKISVPSVLSSISYMLMSQCDNIMITRFQGAEETAVYALVYNIGYILYAIMQATNSVLQAWLYKVLDVGNLSDIKTIQKWYLFLFFQMATGLFMISPEIIKTLSPKNYWEFHYITPFIIGSCLMVMYSFYSTEGLFYKKSGLVSLCVCIAAITNIILNYLLIPKFGGIAAAFTSAVAYLVLFIFLRRLGQHLHNDLFKLKYFLLFLVGILIEATVFEYVHIYVLIRYLLYFAILLISIIYLYYKRNEWILIISRGKK